MGRPTDSPKDTMFRVRLDKESITKMEKAAKILNTTRSDVIRKGIDNIYDGLPK